MNENNITSIIFMPVCKKCKNVIWQEVDCKLSPFIMRGSPQICRSDYCIKPEKCPHCDAWITNITMQASLPFDGKEYTE